VEECADVDAEEKDLHLYVNDTPVDLLDVAVYAGCSEDVSQPRNY